MARLFFILCLTTFSCSALAQFKNEVFILDSISDLKDFELVDLDQDGHLDLIFSSAQHVAWSVGNGDGTFNAPETISDTCSTYGRIDLMDIDLDGDHDLLMACGILDDMFICMNTGGVSFNSGTQLQGSTIHPDIDAHALDLDNDGDMDILYGDRTTSWSHWLKQTAPWTFAPKVQINLATRDMFPVDIDQDGDQDVVSVSSSQLYINLNDGTGQFSLDEYFETAGAWWAHTGDLDDDGLMDLIYQDDSWNGRLLWSKNLGNGAWDTGTSFWLFDGSKSGEIWDVDQNGINDVMVVGGHNQQPNANVLRWYENDGSGLFTHGFDQGDLQSPSSNIWEHILADLDEDGDLDVVVLRISNPTYILWYENTGIHPIWASGTVFYDQNSNGDFDIGESAVDLGQLSLSPDSYYSLTSQGEYTFALDTGNYTVEYVFPNPYWQLSTTGTYDFQLTLQDTSMTDLDFGLIPAIDTTLLQSSVYSDPTRCNWPADQIITVHNQGTSHANGLVELTLDPLIALNSLTPAPDSIVGNDRYWSFSNLAPFQDFQIELDVTMPDVSSIGAILQYMTTTYYVDQNNDLVQSTVSDWSSEMVCGYDPNDKQVSPFGEGPGRAIDVDTEFLTYTVRFQNTGNDTAFNVVIRDQLSDLLDWSSLQILSHSHPMTTLIENDGEAVFKFQNILLPDSNINEPESHGYVLFRINISDDALLGDTIMNTARIFFDYNPPIITNTVFNTLQNDVGIEDQQSSEPDELITVQPNPFSQTTTLIFNKRMEPGSRMEMIDMQGRVVRSWSNISGTQMTIDRSHLANGMYTILISSTKGDLHSARVIIQ